MPQMLEPPDSLAAHAVVDTREPSSDLIDGLPVEKFERNGSRVDFLTGRSEAALSKLFARRAKISNLEVAGAGLEEAFVNLTPRQELSR